jgi:hypothetical protein
MKDFILVVARFDESIDWLLRMPKDMKIIVFNKGEELNYNLEAHPNIKLLNRVHNVGREGETYLRYLVLEYETVPEITVFCQADPFDHHPKYMERLMSVYNDGFEGPIMPLTTRWNQQLPPPVLNSGYDDSFFLETINRFTLCPVMHWDNGMKDTYYQYLDYNRSLKVGEDCYNHFCRLLELPDPDYGKTMYANFFYSGCFAVKKEAVKKYDKYFYLNCLALIAQHPCYGLMFERIWWKLFGGTSDAEASAQNLLAKCIPAKK